jgi:hypothetical protein
METTRNTTAGRPRRGCEDDAVDSENEGVVPYEEQVVNGIFKVGNKFLAHQELQTAVLKDANISRR